MPKEMDTAFYDRIHAYIPGWEFRKTRDDLYTDHFGLVTDYLAEVFHELRKRSYMDYAERYFRFGSHLGGRDQKAVRKTVAGLIKLLHPDGEVTKEEVRSISPTRMEMRRRVKEQLKKMGGLEYWDISFSLHRQGDAARRHSSRSREGRRAASSPASAAARVASTRSGPIADRPPSSRCSCSRRR